MPNHTDNELRLQGDPDQLDAIEKLMARDKNVFNLEALVPMPESVKNTEDGNVSRMGLILVQGEEASRNELNYWLRMPWASDYGITDYQSFCDYVRKTYPNAEEEGKKLLRALEETGCATWYDWSIDNWGTKWNTYEGTVNRLSPTELSYYFQTAWSPPSPVVGKLAERFPSVLIEHYYHDEGGAFEEVAFYRDGHQSALWQDGAFFDECHQRYVVLPDEE